MLPADLNYHLFLVGRDWREALLRRVPARLIRPRRDLGHELTVAVTTFSGRYRHHFLPLYRQICRFFPDVPLVIAVNGGPDPDEQSDYLDQLERQICDHAPAHHLFLLHDRPVGLTHLWNRILAVSPTTTTLILNDDLQLDPMIRPWAEAVDWGATPMLYANASWSHFAISQSVIRQVGAFEPAFPGIGFEDMDYAARLHFAGVQPINVRCAWIHHLDHVPDRTSFDTFSGRSWGKYTSANEAVFYERWQVSTDPGDAWIHQLQARVRPTSPLVPKPLPPLPACLHLAQRIYPQRPCLEGGHRS